MAMCVKALSGTGVGTVAVEAPAVEREVPLAAVVALEEILALVLVDASTVLEPEVAAEESAEVE